MRMAKHLSVILNGIVFLGLTCIVIWDIWLITNTYLYDNRVTLVTWERINNTYPFLRDTRMKIVTNNPKTLFMELWNNESLLEKYTTEKLEAFTHRLENLEQHFNLTDTLPIQERYAVARVLSAIQEIDQNAHYCMHGLADSCDENMNKTSILQNLLQKKQYLLDLENTTWNTLQAYIINEVLALDKSHQFTMDSLVPNEATVSTYLPDIISPRGSAIYWINLFNVPIPDDDSYDDESGEPESVAGVLNVIIRDYKADVIVLSSKKSYTVTIKVTNNGIIDRTETTNCKDETYFDLPYQHLSSMILEPTFESEPCKLREFFETVVPLCQCIPFSFRRQYALVNDTVPDQETLPFCTSQIYMKCMEAVRNAVAKSDKKCLPLCTQAKNQYEVLVSSVAIPAELDITGVKSTSYVFMKVDCNDLIYGLYTEKFQLTLQQYISQLGGEIGLYTGFSILGFWQILVFVYNIYKNHTTKQDSKGPKLITRWRAICAAVIESFVGEADEKDDMRDLVSEIVRREIGDNARTVEVHCGSYMDLKNVITEIQSEMATLKARITGIEESSTLVRNLMVKLLHLQENILAKLDS